MTNLTEKIRTAQVRAGERAVIEDLHDRGLCTSTESCLICQENAARNRKIDSEWVIEQVTGATLESTLAARGAQYGDYDTMADVAQALKGILQRSPNWASLKPTQRESLDVMMTKIARIVCGDPDLPDSWHDVGGYAKLSEDRCPRRAAETPATGAATP